ncbi:MAG: hypothetical protein VXX30_06225, partial [Planctomycetota bacterium]|nr:hypothetical protein [Planctomycetota bacterium]
PPPPPAQYAGPEIQSILGTNVFFKNGRRVSVGETADDVQVLEVYGPFRVKLGWKKGEYEIDLLGGEMPAFFGEKPFSDSTREDLVSEGSMALGSSRPVTSNARESSRARTESSRNTNMNRVPEPLTEAELDSLTRSEITQRIGDIFRGMRADGIDQATKDRLEAERKVLMQKLREKSEDNEA